MPLIFQTVEEYAQIHGVSTAYVRKLAKEGNIPGAEKRGRQWVIHQLQPLQGDTGMKTLAIFNQAGGAGKTTLTQNLGAHLAAQGLKVLLVDLDPQGTLTSFSGFMPRDLNGSVYHAMMQKADLPILPLYEGVSLAPSNILLAGAEQELVAVIGRETTLKRILSPFKAAFDVALIDCPPSLGLLSLNALAASDSLLIPLQPHFKSYLGTDHLLDTFDRVHAHINAELSIIGFVPMMVQARELHDQGILQALREQLSVRAPVLESIGMFTDFKKASLEQVPLRHFSPQHPALEVLDRLAITVMDHLKLTGVRVERTLSAVQPSEGVR